MNIRRACLTTATLLASGVLVAVAAPLGAHAANRAPEAPTVSTTSSVTVPDVVDFGGNAAAAKLRGLGLVPKLVGNGGFVKSQNPRAHTVVETGTTVTLTMTAIRH